jgi:hypothetical protein
MAFSKIHMNNIAGSNGLRNFWVYSDNGNSLATLKAANYFAGADTYGMRVDDCILLVGNNGCGLGWVSALSSTTSTIQNVTAL